MTQMGVFLKRLLLVQVVVFSMTFGLARSVSAQGIVYGDTLPPGAVVENDAILVGDTVVIDGTVAGDVFAAGTNVKIKGTIEGSLIVVGETILIDGQVDGTTYIGAITLELGESSTLGRNLFFAGLSLVTQPGAQVGRDLFAASLLGANLAGDTGRTVKAIIGPSEFIRLILDAVGGQVFLPERSVLPVAELSSLREAKPSLGGALGSIGLAGLRSVADPWLTEGVPSQILDRPGNAVLHKVGPQACV